MKTETIVHDLKVWKEYFQAIKIGYKNFEVRKNDRDYKVGDELLLREWDNETGFHTGAICHRRIDYILHGGQFNIKEGTVVMSISKI